MRKRRRLKSASATHTSTASAIYDRRATELPRGAIVSVVTVDDPYARGERITAVASLRDDPLGLMRARYGLDDARFMAGRHWQRLYEASSIGNLRSVDTTLTPVDGRGGKGVELLTDLRIRAMDTLTRCAEALGPYGDALVRDVLGKGMFVAEAAASRGLGTQRGAEFLGWRFRECLELLAKEFGYA